MAAPATQQPPQIILPTMAQIPPTLAALDRWVAWKFSYVHGRWTKVPIDQLTHQKADTSSPQTWRSLEVTLIYCRKHGSGLGFTLMESDGLVGVDLDRCIDPATRMLHPDAAAIVAEMATYTEISPSGTGVKMIGRGVKPGLSCRTGAFEMYSHKRMFTITGQHLAGTPDDVIDSASAVTAIYHRTFKLAAPQVAARDTTSPPLDDGRILEIARAAANGSKFTALYDHGDITGYVSGSEADAALLAMLAFYTQDPAQIETLFGQSQLCDVKWSNRPDYRKRSISGALGLIKVAYTGPNRPPTLVRRTAPDGKKQILNTETGEIYMVPNADEDEPTGGGPEPQKAALPKIPPFPLDALLSPTLRSFVEKASVALDAPQDFAAWGALAACSGAIGNSRVFEVNREWKESALLWIAIVGKPGTGKTPALNKATAPLWDLQSAMIAEWEQEKSAYDSRLAHWEGESKHTRGEKPQPPAMKRFMMGDTTFEALTNVLKSNERGIIVARDELAGWVESFNQYKKAGGQDRAAWLSTWSSSPVIIDRKTDNYMAFLKRPYVSVVGTIQPDRLAAMTGAADDGFLDRLLFTYPDAWPMRWTEASIDVETTTKYAELLRAILGFEMASTATEKGTSYFPHTVKPSLRARATFSELFEDHRKEMLDPDLPANLLGVWAKYRSYAGRLALVIHCALVADGVAVQPLVLEEPTILAAWALIDHLKSHARRIYQSIGRTDEDHQIDRAVTWIKAHGGSVTLREFARNNVAGVRGAKAAEELMNSLVDRGLGHIERESKPGATIVRFVLITASEEV